MPALSRKYSQRLIIFQNPQICCSVSRTRSKITSQWREFNIPYRLIVPVVNHQRPLGLQTPPSYGVVIWPTQKVLIANRNGHCEYRPRVPDELVLLFVALFSWRIINNLVLGRNSLVWLQGRINFLFLWRWQRGVRDHTCRFLLFFFFVGFIFTDLILMFCYWSLYNFEVFLNLLFNHIIDCQYIMLLFRQNEYLNGGIRHACGHDCSWVW